MSLNFKKLTAAIHYICDQAKFDGIRINKALWYSDAFAYISTGASITGTTYIRKGHGPVSRHYHIAAKALQEAGKLIGGKKHDDNRGKWDKVLDSVGTPSKTLFDGKELQIIDDVIKALQKYDAFSAGERTHGDIWKIADSGEELPIYTIFAEKLGEVTPDHIKLASANL